MTSHLLPPLVPQFRSTALAPEPAFVPTRAVEPLSRTASERVPAPPYAGLICETGRDAGWVLSEYLRRTGGQALPTLPPPSGDTPEGHVALPLGLNPTKPYAMAPVDWGHPAPRCKHRREDCDACGTTARRDFAHTTRGGRGVVGALSRK